MPTATSPFAVAAPALLNVSVDLLELVPGASAPQVEVRQGTTGISRIPARRVGLGRRLRRLGSVVGDIAGILAFAYAVPIVILAIGIPLALLVRLAIWVLRAL